MDFELTNYIVSIQHISQYVTWTSPKSLIRSSQFSSGLGWNVVKANDDLNNKE